MHCFLDIDMDDVSTSYYCYNLCIYIYKSNIGVYIRQEIVYDDYIVYDLSMILCTVISQIPMTTLHILNL